MNANKILTSFGNKHNVFCSTRMNSALNVVLNFNKCKKRKNVNVELSFVCILGPEVKMGLMEAVGVQCL